MLLNESDDNLSTYKGGSINSTVQSFIDDLHKTTTELEREQKKLLNLSGELKKDANDLGFEQVKLLENLNDKIDEHLKHVANITEDIKKPTFVDNLLDVFKPQSGGLLDFGDSKNFSEWYNKNKSEVSKLSDSIKNKVNGTEMKKLLNELEGTHKDSRTEIG